MLKKIRLAATAAVLLLAVAGATLPQSAFAQTQPATPAPAAAPAEVATPAPAPGAPAAKAPAPNRSRSSTIPYGLEALLKGSDIVAKITLAILVIMSMGSWYIIITKIYEQAKMGKQAKAADRTFWKAPVRPERRGRAHQDQPVSFRGRNRPRGDEQARPACSAMST